MPDWEGFMYTPMMAVEILIAEFMFALRQERKEYFSVRWLGSACICLAATIWIEIIYMLVTDRLFLYASAMGFYDSVFKFIYYLVIFLLTIGCVGMSFEANVQTVLLYCSGGYITQHMANNVVSLILYLPVFDEIRHHFWVQTIFRVVVYALLYTFVYVVFIRGQSIAYGSEKNLRRKVMISFAVVFLCIGLSRITTDDIHRGITAVVAETLYAIICCLLVLNMMYDLSENDRIRQEVDVMTELLHRDREQYRLTKENIDIINRKCHDLKHQISSLKEDLSEEHIREIRDAVMIYDSVINVKTGNDVLDVILTEKSLQCEQNGIVLTCMAHGECLEFMDKMDLYSLFGNALSNAIEAVKQIEDAQKKCVSVNVSKRGEMLFIHVENFYREEPVFADGLPVTKKDRSYHGFGMKSMDYIAKKYGGAMSALASDGRFYLDFAIPVGEKTFSDSIQTER